MTAGWTPWVPPEWENFIAGLDVETVMRERMLLPHPELERPGSAEDRRMQRMHAQQVREFAEQSHRPQKLSRLQRFEIRTYRDRPESKSTEQENAA